MALGNCVAILPATVLKSVTKLLDPRNYKRTLSLYDFNDSVLKDPKKTWLSEEDQLKCDFASNDSMVQRMVKYVHFIEGNYHVLNNEEYVAVAAQAFGKRPPLSKDPEREQRIWADVRDEISRKDVPNVAVANVIRYLNHVESGPYKGKIEALLFGFNEKGQLVEEDKVFVARSGHIRTLGSHMLPYETSKEQGRIENFGSAGVYGYWQPETSGNHLIIHVPHEKRGSLSSIAAYGMGVDFEDTGGIVSQLVDVEELERKLDAASRTLVEIGTSVRPWMK